MNLTIKNVPPKVHTSLKKEAARKGRSLNSAIIEVLSNSAAEVDRRARMRATRGDLERFVASLPKMSSSVPLIRADRESH